jgi:hypothetical protein
MGAAVPVESLGVVRGGRRELPGISLDRAVSVTGLLGAEQLMNVPLAKLDLLP